MFNRSNNRKERKYPRSKRRSDVSVLLALVMVAVIGAMCLAGAAYADPLDTWTTRVSGITATLRSIAYGNGTFVAVGDNNTILTSMDNGVTWTLRNSGTTSSLSCIAYSNGTFVAVGNSGTILTSTDNGVTWTLRNSGTTSGLSDIAYGNGTFVAVGNSGTILTSTDNGVTWALRNSGTTSDLWGIAYGNGTFVFVGYTHDNAACVVVTTIIATSTDNGVTWTSRTLGTTSALWGIVYGNGVFTTVGPSSAVKSGGWCFFGGGAAIFTSMDNGDTWVSRNSGTDNHTYDYLSGIAYGNGTFVAVGLINNGILTSADSGTTWTLRVTNVSSALFGIIYGNGTFATVGYNGTILTSTVGVGPTPTPTPTQYTITASVDYGTGSISCTPTVVDSGGTSTCTVTPGSGQMLVSLTDNGTNVINKVVDLVSYTITNITANHTIVATFATTSVCTNVTITPTSKNFPASGGIGNVSVTTNTNCSFTFSSDASWITNLYGTPGEVNNDIANYTISYAVTPNTGSQRTGIITISGQTFTVTQDGQATDVTLTVVKAGEGSGAVTITPPGIDCSMNTPSAECRVPFAQGTSVTLTAAADTGSTFTGWSGDCSGTTSTCTLTMSAAKNVTATFNAAPKPKHTTHDFDGDGKSDILWQNVSNGAVGMWFMNGPSIADGKIIVPQNYTDWQMVDVGDFDGNGKTDILWQNASTGQLYIWLMDGSTIMPTSGSPSIIPDLDWQIVGIGDFDGDGESDILWQNGWNGDVAIWFMNGTNIVFDKSKTIQIVDDSDWWIYAVGDFDGNGKSDILWQNASTGQLYIWLMDGSNIMPTSGSPFTVSNTDWQIVDVGDFDGDGKSDILWQDAVTGAVAIWFMNASNITSPKIVVPKNYTDWQIVDVGDFNGDGKSDILWRQASTGQLYIWLMDGSNIMPTSGSPSIIPELDWQVFGSSVQNGEI